MPPKIREGHGNSVRVVNTVIVLRPPLGLRDRGGGRHAAFLLDGATVQNIVLNAIFVKATSCLVRWNILLTGVHIIHRKP